jgi:hypothetical protein
MSGTKPTLSHPGNTLLPNWERQMFSLSALAYSLTAVTQWTYRSITWQTQ